MKIISIFAPDTYLFSIQYDEQEEDEYTRLLYTEWNELDKVLGFMQENSELLKTDYTWDKIKSPFLAASQVLKEADDLRELFHELNKNTKNGKHPNYDDHFQFLNGPYKNVYELVPVKSYGNEKPSLLRIYAIKLDTNKYLITGGGIKLCRKIQDSPGIKNDVLKNINKVRNFLIKNGITSEDFE